MKRKQKQIGKKTKYERSSFQFIFYYHFSLVDVIFIIVTEERGKHLDVKQRRIK